MYYFCGLRKMLPLTNPVQQSLEQLLQDLPSEYQEMAIEFKAFVRPRKIQNPMELMQLVLMYCGIDKTLRDTAGNLTLLRERITDTAVHKRLLTCTPWLKALLQKMWPGIAKLPGSMRLIVIDASSVSAPGATGTSYRLHLAMDLPTLTFTHVEVTDQYSGESLKHFPLTANDVVLLDRGYNHPKTIAEYSLKGVSVVLRLSPHAMPLYQVDSDERIDLYQRLKGAESNEITLPVRLINKKQQPVTGWVHARRLPEELRAEARRKCRVNSKSGNPKQETLLFSEWLLVFTTVSPSVIDRQTVCSLYSLRWQVELIFKRLKSLLDIDQLRCKEGSKLGDVWLYGKLLFATLLVKRSHRHFGTDNLMPECGRDITPWRLWRLLKNEAITLITCVQYWKPSQLKLAVQVLKERPRKRKLQTLPLPVARLLTSVA